MFSPVPQAMMSLPRSAACKPALVAFRAFTWCSRMFSLDAEQELSEPELRPVDQTVFQIGQRDRVDRWVLTL